MSNAFTQTTGASIFSKDRNFTSQSYMQNATAKGIQPTMPDFILPNTPRNPAPKLVLVKKEKRNG